MRIWDCGSVCKRGIQQAWIGDVLTDQLTRAMQLAPPKGTGVESKWAARIDF
jgi:hypothetical protein